MFRNPLVAVMHFFVYAGFIIINIEVLEIVLDGIMIGALFALAAYGLALVWGVMNVKNLAQGDFVIAGGYCSWWLVKTGFLQSLGLSDNAAALIGVLLAFIGVGLYEFRKVARRRRGTGEPPGLTEKIAGVAFSGLAILFVVQGFDPHLTLRGTADILFPLLGCVGFLLQPLSFWKGTSLDKALYEQPGPIEPAQATVGVS